MPRTANRSQRQLTSAVADEFARLAAWWNNGILPHEKRLLCLAGGVDLAAANVMRWEWLETEQRFGVSAGLRKICNLSIEWMQLAR